MEETGLKYKLRELRISRNLSANKMSKETGFSRTSIWAWENGTRTPRLDTLELLEEYYKLPVGCLSQYFVSKKEQAINSELFLIKKRIEVLEDLVKNNFRT